MVEEDNNGGGADDHGLVAAASAPRHIKKRALRNKAFSVPFSDKDLKDYVTGFHKRKKKRRKEAQKNLQEKERLKRIEERKKRKLEKEIMLNGGFLPEERPESGDRTPVDLDDDLADGCKRSALVPGTKVYDMGETTITVTTSEIFPEEDNNDVEFHQFVKCSGAWTEPLKRIPGQKFRVKTRKSASQRKGKKSRNRR